MTRPLRVGVQLPEVERSVTWTEVLSIARAAEDVGFDSVWVGDHLLYRDDDRPERGPFDAWSILAGLAAATERVDLGPLVTCLGFRPAGVLAKIVRTVDEMSSGRLVLGVGCGWNRTEFDAFGFPFDDRVARFEESFEVLRRLLEGGRVTLPGRYVRLEDAVLYPRSDRRTRLMVGSNGDRMLRATLPFVECWNTWWDAYGNTPEGFAKLNERITAAAQTAGRNPAELGRSACVLVVLDPASDERPTPAGVVPLGGTVTEMAGRLAQFAEAGADEAILVVNPITRESVETLGRTLAVLDR